MKDVEQHKNILDGGMVLGGTAYVTLAEHLPIIIGFLTAVLFAARIYIAIQEIRLNKKKLDDE